MIKYFVLALGIGVIAQATALHAAEYVEISKDNVNIRTSASSSATVVGQAAKGMIFRLIGTRDEWHEIALPSGEYRYFHSSLGGTVADAPGLTSSKDVLVNTCREFVAAENKAVDESTAKEPDIMKQIDLGRLLVDRYKLTIFKKYGIPPARTTELTVWCAKNRNIY